MQRSNGALALDDGDGGSRLAVPASGTGRLRPARRSGLLRGPGKYHVLEHRRRQAQIRARRVLDLLDLAESGLDLAELGLDLAASGEETR